MSFAFLPRPGSTLGERVAGLVTGECFLLAPEARVRVEDRRVLWGGKRLDTLSALVLEAPPAPWPQPVAEARPGESAEEHQRRGLAARERRALRVAALRQVTDRVRVANDPGHATEFDYSAALALERLELAKLPVRPWRVLSAASAEAGWALVPFTAGHASEEAVVGPCHEVELGGRSARAHLCVGGKWIAASAPEAALETRLARAAEPPAAERELATAALSALGLVFGAVHVCDGAVARVAVAPDLDAWDRAHDGHVARALAAWMTSTLLSSAPSKAAP
jgi:hypothetical protein